MENISIIVDIDSQSEITENRDLQEGKQYIIKIRNDQTIHIVDNNLNFILISPVLKTDCGNIHTKIITSINSNANYIIANAKLRLIAKKNELGTEHRTKIFITTELENKFNEIMNKLIDIKEIIDLKMTNYYRIFNSNGILIDDCHKLSNYETCSIELHIDDIKNLTGNGNKYVIISSDYLITIYTNKEYKRGDNIKIKAHFLSCEIDNENIERSTFIET